MSAYTTTTNNNNNNIYFVTIYYNIYITGMTFIMDIHVYVTGEMAIALGCVTFTLAESCTDYILRGLLFTICDGLLKMMLDKGVINVTKLSN